MPIKSNVPIRIGGSRARSGCRTCKQRHVKCDEGQPVCFKCQRGNRRCVYDVFQAPVRHSPSRDSSSSQLTFTSAADYLNCTAWPSPNSSISPYGAMRTADMSAIQHFANQLGKELAGNFSNTIWCDVLPRVAQHEPSIWHGIMAVSTLDMDLRRNYSSHHDMPNSSAIMHYSKAMQELHTRVTEPDEVLRKDVILLCCILFAVFECLQSHFHSALRHISGGMKLLMEWGSGGQLGDQVSLGNYLNRTMLQSIFLFLDSQAIQLGAHEFRNFFSGPALDDQLRVTQSVTVEDAHLLLTHIFHRISHWENWSEPVTACGNMPEDEWMVTEKQRIQAQLVEWDGAFGGLLSLEDPQPASLLLLVHRKTLQIFFGKTADGTSEMEWDKYLPLFEEVVSHAEAYMCLTANEPWQISSRMHHEPTEDQGSRPILTVAMDIVLPLFLISTRCRQSSVRRRALDMVRSCNRREGIWDSHLCAGIAEKIIRIEENAASEDGHIPESARMCMLDIRLGEEEGRTAEVSVVVQDSDGLHKADSLSGGVLW